MDSSLYNPWVQNEHQRLQQADSVQWSAQKAQSASHPAPSGAQVLPLTLSDFQNLNDLNSSSSQNSSGPPQSQFYGSYGVQNANNSSPNNFILQYQSNSIPYNSLGWGQPQQSQPRPQQLSPYPLSNPNAPQSTPGPNVPAPIVLDPTLSLNGASNQQGSNYNAPSTFPTQSSPSNPPQPEQQNASTFESLLGQYLRSQQGHPQPSQQPAPSEALSPQSLQSPAPPPIFPGFTQQQLQDQPQQQLSQFYQQQTNPSSAPPSSFISPSALQQQTPTPFHSASSPPQSYQHSQNVPTRDVLPLQPPPKPPLLPTLKPFLSPTSFTGAGAVRTLINEIVKYGINDVDASTRMEVFTKIRDSAGNPYFRAWSENPDAMEVTREWLRAGFLGDKEKLHPQDNIPYLDTVMPILHVIDRLPISVENLKASKLGKLIVKLVKDPPSPAIKDMAANIERRWRDLVEAEHAAAAKGPAANATEGPTAKKRKLSTAVSEVGAGKDKAVKRQAVASANPTKPATIKKETVTTTTKDAKSDSSFFSSRATKAKLPSFKKSTTPASSGSSLSANAGAAAPGTAKKEEHNISKPSNFDAFADVLKSMNNSKKPVVGTTSSSTSSATSSTNPSSIVSPPRPPTPMNVDSPPPATASSLVAGGLNAQGRKRKRVSWAPDHQLENVKLIDRAVYDDDHGEGMHHINNIRDMDRGEGAALHAHLFEETMDWVEPSLIEIPESIKLPVPGSSSSESTAQQSREQVALVTLYMNAEQIPDTPHEPTHVIPDIEVDKEVKQMQLGDEADAIFWAAQEAQQQQQQFSGAGGDLFGGGFNNGMMGGVDQAAALLANSGAAPDQVQMLLSMLAQGAAPSGIGTTGFGQNTLANQQGGGFGGSSGWDQGSHHHHNQAGNHHFGASGGLNAGGNFGGEMDDSHPPPRWESGGRGGRGRGAGRGRGRGRGGRKLCTFFLAGRCKFGDQCDFLHEYPS